MIAPPDSVASTRPYLIRALHQWCIDNGYTPFIAVAVDATVQVPREFVKDNEIVFNTSFDATSHLSLGNELIEFKARFGGVPRDVVIPVDHVIAIYARENGQGMTFPAPVLQSTAALAPSDAAAPPPTLHVVSTQEGIAATAKSGGEPSSHPDKPTDAPSPSRPTLTRVK